MPELRWSLTEDFTPGFSHKRDVSQLKPGALIVGSKNVVLNDGDRVTVRRGSQLFGAASTATTPIKSAHTMRKRNGTEIPLRTYGTVVEYRHPTTTAWENLNSGYTTGQKFGFADHNVNTEANDFTYFCNAVEPYSRWNGAYDTLSGTYAGAEATITIVGDHFTADTYHSDTASASTTTTIDIATAKWATDIWNGFYVHVTSGAQAGKISKISATTTTRITFDTITGLSGTPTFEIRQLKWDDSDKKLRVGTSNVTYTGYGSNKTFTGASGMPAAADGAAVAQAVKEYPENPRGNILKVLHTRMLMAGVKAKQGKEQQSAIHYSKIADAKDFTFGSPRAADDGGVADFPEGGGAITGIETQEDTIYVFKEDNIHTMQFTTSGTAAELDIPQIRPLITSPRGGAVGSLAVVKADGEVFYVSPEEGIKSVRRPEVADFARPQQLSDPIVTFVNDLTMDDAAGIFFKRKAYFAARSEGATTNDTLLVFNFDKRAWEAPRVGQNISVFTIFGDELYGHSSNNPETFKLEVEDLYADNDAPYEAIARFSYNNFGEPALPKEFDMMFLEGYISESTTLNVKLRYNYNGGQEVKVGTISGTDSDYIVAAGDLNILGDDPIGLEPLAGALPDESPNPLQKFRVYFTTTKTPFYELSLECASDQAGSVWELLRYGTNVNLMSQPITKLKKKLS